MKTYRVKVEVKATFEYEVEANNRADAKAEAIGMAEGGEMPEDFVATEVGTPVIETEVKDAN